MSIRPMLLNPLEEPLNMIAVCLGFGAVHLFFGLGVAAYMNFKRGKPLAVVMDQLSWFVLVVGLALLLLPQFASLGMVMAILGALTVLLFAGRDKENFIKRLVSGFGALYGVTSWLSDLLSYMRLFGMGLATGVIGMVINMLVGLMMGKNIVFTLFGVVILVGGHIFNAAINIMGAYIHSCRLQYIEFFGKFYEDGGRPFNPLKQNPRYYTIRKTDLDRASSS
jgi:V/A-type H+-transporting ATPase subunit I